MKSNYTETPEQILTSLQTSLDFKLAIKLVIEGECDAYFGTVIEITDTTVTVDYEDCVETVELNKLTDVYTTWE